MPEPPPEPPVPPRRLDPDRAAAAAGAGRQAQTGAKPQPGAEPTGAPSARAPSPVIDTRPYRWMIGIFGMFLVLVISVYQFVANGVGTVGIPVGKPLHNFAAPIATTTLNGDANLNPPCTLAGHDPRALNVCLLVKRASLVLAFFVTGSGDCRRQIDTVQTVASEFSRSQVQFAAVAVHAGHRETAALVRAHHWTIPVAYDRDGAVGVFYGVETCPMLELARRGGIVADRLVGDHWLNPAALAARVRALLG